MTKAERVTSQGRLVLATTLLLFAAAPVDAIPIVGTFTGTIDSGTDISDYFGTGGGDLTGQALSGTLSYDTDTAPAPSAPGQFLSSGALNWLSASITINGASYSFDAFAADPATNHDLVVGVTDEPDSFSLNVTRTTVLSDTVMEQQLALFVLEGLGDFTSGLELPQSLSWSADAASSSAGTFLVSCYTEGCASPAFAGSFSLSTLSLAPVAVPEPGTLGLLGVGFLAICFFFGRRGQRPPRKTATLPT
jgi:hypothetical protein